MELPKMRTVKTAMAEIRALDPDTDITVNAMQTALRQGKVAYINVGKKRLFRLDDMIRYFTARAVEPEIIEPQEPGKIRPVKA